MKTQIYLKTYTTTMSANAFISEVSLLNYKHNLVVRCPNLFATRVPAQSTRLAISEHLDLLSNRTRASAWHNIDAQSEDLCSVSIFGTMSKDYVVVY